MVIDLVQSEKNVLEIRNTAQLQAVSHPFYFSVLVMLIFKDTTVTVECRAAIKRLLFDINWCLSVHTHPYIFIVLTLFGWVCTIVSTFIFRVAYNYDGNYI
jgi:hypothetical protein